MLEDLIQHRPTTLSYPPVSAIVTQVAGADVLVTPVGADPAHPLGPCKGVKSLAGNPLAVGAHVLVIFTSDGPWIAAVDE